MSKCHAVILLNVDMAPFNDMLRWCYRSPFMPWLSSMVGNSWILSLKVFISRKCYMILYWSLFRALTSWYFPAFDFLQVHFQMHNEVILLLVRSYYSYVWNFFSHACSMFEAWKKWPECLFIALGERTSKGYTNNSDPMFRSKGEPCISNPFEA